LILYFELFLICSCEYFRFFVLNISRSIKYMHPLYLLINDCWIDIAIECKHFPDIALLIFLPTSQPPHPRSLSGGKGQGARLGGGPASQEGQRVARRPVRGREGEKETERQRQRDKEAKRRRVRQRRRESLRQRDRETNREKLCLVLYMCARLTEGDLGRESLFLYMCVCVCMRDFSTRKRTVGGRASEREGGGGGRREKTDG
jgi:hypothetical protein